MTQPVAVGLYGDMFFVGHPSTLSERFAWILTALVQTVAARRTTSKVFASAAWVLWNRIMAVSTRVVALIREIEAGVVRPLRVRKPEAGPRPKVEVSAAARERFAEVSAKWRGVPTHRGWLVGKGGWQVALFLSQLEALLREPEMKRLLAADPRLGMAMRPVCRMLGVDPRLYENVEALPEVADPAPPQPEPPPAPVKSRVEDNEAGIPWWQQKWAQ